MSCNCNNTTPCTQCSAGSPCNCPPDYSVLPQPVDCHCCPAGYTFYGPTANYPNGFCCLGGDGTGNNCVSVAVPVACNDCTESISADCVFVSDMACLGVAKGANVPLSTVLAFLCSDAFTLKMLQNIGLSTNLKAALCEIVSVCPTVGSTVPIPGPIIVTIP